jgi:hypothetical protein
MQGAIGLLYKMNFKPTCNCRQEAAGVNLSGAIDQLARYIEHRPVVQRRRKSDDD